MIDILYVDDDPVLLALGKDFLEEIGGFRVELQGSASGALGCIGTRKFDAIISDYQMPEMDGLEFLRRVRQDYGQIPFILFTGRGREEVVILALNSGADFYLQKGGEPQSQFAELAHKIRQAVHRRKADLALEASERRYRDVVETQTEFICRFRPDGTHVFVNEAYCRYFGMRREEIVGHRFTPEIPPDDRKRIRHHFATLTPDHPVAELEHTVILPGGSLRWHWWSDRAIFDGSGTVTEYQSVGKDITDRKTAEAAHAEIAGRLRNLGENLPGIIFQFERTADGKYRFPYISGRWSEIFDVDTREAMRIPELVLARIVPEDLAEITRAVSRSAAELTPWQMEFRAQIRGKTMWIYGRSIPDAPRPDGTILWNGVLIDITERKHVEEALRESEEKFRVLSDTVPVAIVVYQGTRIVYVNDFTVKATGFCKEEICAMDFWDIVHTDIREILKMRGLARQRGEDVPGRYEIKYLTRSGETRWADVSVGMIMFGGEPAGIASLQDITERKRAEEALKTSEKDYRSIIENIQDAFYRTDTDGNLTLVSPSFARLFGYSAPEDVHGENIRDTFYFTPSERDEFLRKILTDGEIVEFRLTLKHKDGTPVIVSASSHVFCLENGKPGGVEGILHDITDRVKVESVLAESESKYRELLETLPYMVFEMDPSLRITYANRCAIDMLGVTREDLELGINARDLVDPSEHSRMLKNLQVSAEGRPAAGREYRAVRRDGSTFPAIIYSAPLHAGQNIAGYRGLMIDVSTMRMMEQDLLESREKFQSLVDQSLDGILIVDASGLLLFANRMMGELIGFDPGSELVGITSIFDFVLPEFQEQARHEFSLVTEERDCYLASYKIRTRKNSELWIECIGRIISFEGKKAVLLSIRDITSRKTLEGIVRENEEMYRNLADSLPDYVLVHRDGKILYANRAILETLNLSYEKAISSSVFDFVAPESRRWILENIRRRVSGEESGMFEVEVIVDRGVKRHGLVHSAITSYRGEPAHLVVITDITERKQAELALKLSNSKLNMLSSITRHDLLNKLTALRAYLELSRKAAVNHPELLAFLEKEQQIAGVMYEQINFTGFYQDIGVKKPEWTSLETIIGAAARQLPLSQIALDIHVGGLQVYADPLIGKVFYNLMENSLRHGGHVSSIAISSREYPGGMAIEYCDNGTGIPAADKERIFERGFGNNSGLGMFLSREILSITGITIEETGISGKGVRFVISVPDGTFRRESTP